MSGEGMSGLVTELTGTNGITSANLWTEVTQAAPLIIGIFIFAFRLLRSEKITTWRFERQT